jgi:AraC family transcriptional regulator
MKAELAVVDTPGAAQAQAPSIPLSSAEAFERHVPGERVASSGGEAWKDVLAQVFERRPVEDSFIIPAVPEPLIVWVLSGTAEVAERELGGEWKSNRVAAGDFFLTTSPRPCELRWVTEGAAPFRVMHLYLGLDLMKRAIRDVLDEDAVQAGLREASGECDTVLSMFLTQLHAELVSPRAASALFVQGLAQSLAVHLVRAYADPDARRQVRRGGLPAFKLQRVLGLMESGLDQDFQLARLAQEAELSEYHFCRVFKTTTGFAPSRYFIRLRIEHARRLLRETTRSIIEIGLEVGYASPSHFAQVFRREVGVTPSAYRTQG